MSQMTKVNLHERLKKHPFRHALIATFNLNVRFFEDYALENFRSLQDNANVTVLLDAGEYQELLGAAAADPESFPRQANLRYLLHPIRVRGVFHPKVFFFASEKRGLLIIGSANCTSHGLGSNAEIVSIFDYEEGKNESAVALFQAAFRFFEELATRWPGEHFKSNVEAIAREVPWLIKKLPESDTPDLPVLLSNLDEPLWDQLFSRLPRNQVTRLSVLSRFFDAEPELLDEVVRTTGAAKVALYTQNYITTLTAEWLRHPSFKAGDLEVRLCLYADDEHSQQLHGKAYAFECGEELLLAMGSANFTTPALICTPDSGNLEVLLCYPPVPACQCSVSEWFDPAGNATVLRSASQLITALDNTDEPQHQFNRFPMTIREAWVDYDNLVFRLDDDIMPASTIARLSQGNRRPFFLWVNAERTPHVAANLDAAQQRRLREAPAIVELGSGTGTAWRPVSNAVLIANLQDISTGGDVRRQRQIREARESPQRFIEVLMALSRSDDEERLKQFLTYCDIPIDLPTRLYRNRRKAGSDTGGIEAMRTLGAQNLRYFLALHDAVMDFVGRHRRRLDRHIESGSAKGIPNFLHILLTVGKLLLSQIDRLVIALEAETQTEVRPDRWFEIRNYLDDYYRALEQLLQITAVDYLDAMLESASLAEIAKEFSDSVPELTALYERAIKNRDILDQLRQTRLAITNPGGRAITHPDFFKSVLGMANWRPFETNIRRIQQHLKQRLVA
jgi:HKD family nuclease